MTVFVCLFLLRNVNNYLFGLFGWLCFVSLNYAKDVFSIIFCFSMNFWDL